MIDRSFNEVELRDMLQRATSFRDDPPGRYIIETTHRGRAWEVVVEADEPAKLLVVVTAFEVG